MFDPTSRYASLDTATLDVTGSDGQPRTVRYVRRRFVPLSKAATLVEHTVVEGDRLDTITAQYLGDPTQFWRVCDANNALHPTGLTAESGAAITISLPQWG